MIRPNETEHYGSVRTSIEEVYRIYKPLLFPVAYRMLGSVSDAEDIIQDVFVSLPLQDLEQIDHLKNYLVKMVVNRCLNDLKSARKRREAYVGPWLPEPLFTGIAINEPLERVVQEEDLTYAFLVLLQELSPLERAVFVLREVLGYEYHETAEMLHKTEANCRKIYSRAKGKLKPYAAERRDELKDTSHLVNTFLHAVQTGSFDAFIRLLTDDAVLMSDGGGKRRAALRPILGKHRIRAFWEGLLSKGALAGEWVPIYLNGQPGAALFVDGSLSKTICFAKQNCHLAHRMFIILNPDKLKALPSRL
ncbi:RNA polymerase sigma factor SigJ [Marinicrinis lubricantis]|uniref:RNA polymerase sigma factor SigJ n=1 Tax=Marinicrinis lubricantis TaxID=2086470 RepID=A0ABW1IK20_9BACL